MTKQLIVNDDFFIDANGFAHIEAVLASESVLEYTDNEGNEYRVLLPGEVIEDAIRHMDGIITTNDHPDSKEVTTANYKDLSVGYLKPNLTFTDGRLRGETVFCDEDTIKAIEGGKQDLSMGYRPKIAKKSGIFVDKYGTQGEPGLTYPYDYEYTELRYNHCALVDEGRSKSAALVLDSAGNCPISFEKVAASFEINPVYTSNDQSNRINPIMPDAPKLLSIVINDSIIPVTAESQPIINDMKQKLAPAANDMKLLNDAKSEMEAAIDAYKAEVDSYKAKLEELQAENDGIKASIDSISESSLNVDEVAAQVDARLATWNEIGGVDNDVVAFDSKLTPLEIKRQYLIATTEQKEQKAVIADASEAFVNGFFFGAPKKVKTASKIFNQAPANDSAKAPAAKKGGWKSDGSWSLR